jgi:FKBP-type peptidyl-prolyl cis-trans isomerase 2
VEAVKKKLNEAFEQIRQGKKNVTVDLNEDPDIVQKGDLAHAHYTASLEDGTLIHTTHSEVARGASKKAVGYEEPKSFVPEDVLVGAEPGVRGLEDALVGMTVGEQKRVTVPPEKAYGPRDPDKVVDFPRVAKRPKMVEMPPDEYLGRYGKFPVQGAEVNYDAYFNAIVLDVTEDHATLSMFPVEEGPIQDTFGTTVVTEAEEEMEVTLAPKIGGAFRLKDQDGRVVASDSENFTVDFNHPLAGENVVFEVELLSLTKASAWRDTQIPWMEDYEEAIAAAGRGDKPIVLVLYADWCGFSKKLFDRTMEDPRIKVLKDRFVWLKIDSSKDCFYKNRFGQEGYPMIVVMDPEGLVLEKMNGYRDGKTLREGLEEYLGQTERG